MKKLLAVYLAGAYAYSAFDLIKEIRDADDERLASLRNSFSQTTPVLALTVALVPAFYPVEFVMSRLNK